MTNNAYAKNKGDGLLCSILCCNCKLFRDTNKFKLDVMLYFNRKTDYFSALRILIFLGVTSLQTSCYKSVHKLSTSCVRTACSQFVLTSLKQAVDNL